MKVRQPQPDDQEKCDRAERLLVELTQLNPDIDANQWSGAAFTCIVKSMINSGICYKQFVLEMARMAAFYKHYWEEE